MEQILQYEIFQKYQALLSINFVQRVSIFGKEECQFDYIKDVHFDIHVPTFCRMKKKEQFVHVASEHCSKDLTGPNRKCLGQGHGMVHHVPSPKLRQNENNTATMLCWYRKITQLA